MLTRVAIIADSHFDEHSRFEECIRLHRWIADDIGQRGVSLVAHGGDLYERKSTPLERAAAADFVHHVTTYAPLLIVRGNHDNLDDLPLLARLETKHPVTVEQAAGVHIMGGIAIGALAWPSKSALLASLPVGGKEAGEHAAADALRNVLRGLGQEMASNPNPRMLVAHAMVRGSVTSTGQPLVGCDLEIGLEDLALADADLYALGHIHKGQAWDIAGAPCVYPGSPRRTAFGELEAKGYVVATWDGVRFTTEFIEAPATKMVQIETWFTPANASLGVGPQLSRDNWALADVADAEVRLRYQVDSDQRDAARVLAQELRVLLLECGALSVKLEEVVSATTRARTPEVSAAVSINDKLDALWRAQRFDPAARRQPLLNKVSLIQGDVRQ